jgi:hypothetical protein
MLITLKVISKILKVKSSYVQKKLTMPVKLRFNGSRRKKRMVQETIRTGVISRGQVESIGAVN